MYTLALLFFSILVVSFLDSPTMGGGWIWDADNALGFAALAGMLALSRPGVAQRDVRGHEWLGYTILAIAAVHVFWFLLTDSAAIEYLKPGAPMYMLTGIAGFILLVVLAAVAAMPTRLTLHKSYASFRYLHRLIAIGGIAFSLHHVIASGFYLRTWYQSALIVILAAVAVFVREIRRQPPRADPLTPAALIAVSLAGCAVFAFIRNVGT